MDDQRLRGGGEHAEALGRYAVLDTVAEEGFDDLVALASEGCAAPTALVSLLTSERQWFKARIGFDAAQTPIADAICVLTVQEPDLLVIPDLTQDPRTRSSALVTRPGGIRFYAGVPLRMPSGAVLGSLCVIDSVPRPDGLTGGQATLLRRLGRQVVAQLELRRLLVERDGNVAAGRIAHDRLAEDQAALTIKERHWRGLFEKLSEGFLVGEIVRDGDGRGVDWRYLDVNAAWSGLYGLPPDAAVGRTVREVLPAIEQGWIEDAVAVVDTGLPRTVLRQIGPAGRDYECHAFHLDDDRFAMIFIEVTDRLRAAFRQEALLTLGDRLREAGSIAEMTRTAARIVGETLGVTRAGFGRIDLAAETIELEADWSAPGMRSIAGVHRFADYGDLLPDLLRGAAVVIDDVRTDRRAAADPAALLDLDIASLVNMPVRERDQTVAAFIVHHVQPRRWSPDELAFLRNVADRVEVGVGRLRGEERQRVLNQELSHRLKNTLAMVQAIAVQTLKRVTERDAVSSFEQRLGALASAHDVLLGKNWAAADLATVAERVLEVIDARGRFRIEGPPLELGARAALSASLLLHELGTNALKYGALSAEGGRVAVRWTVDGDAMTLDWQESGGPAAPPPTRKGFGSRLINLGLVGTGGVTVRYEKTGFSATMRASTVELQQA